MNLVRFNNHPNYSRFLNELMTDDYRYTHKNCNTNVPATNIIENEEGYELAIAVPGIKKKDININLEKSLLTISSEKEENKEKDNVNFTRKEFGFNTFSRSYSLPKSIDVEKIKADYLDGVLKVSLPKKEEEKVALSREIKVG